MLAPSLDLDRRRPVWEALSELFLDTRLGPEDHRRIARALAASGYSPSEVERILTREVAPVLVGNLSSPAGEWAGFDLARLEAEILRRERRWFAWRPGRLLLRSIRDDWDAVRALLGSS